MPTTDARARPGRPGGTVRPAAASTLSPAWLAGDPGPARVVAAFDRAVYLLRDEEVLPVLAPGALLLPGGLRLGSSADLHALRLRVGEEVLVGHGRVVTEAGSVVVRRTWRPVPVGGAGLAPRSVTDLLDVIGGLPRLTDDLPPTLVRAVGDLPRASVTGSVVGLGPGLTPAGDDLLCGALLALLALGDRAGHAALVRGLAPFLPRTTALSATLLRQAALGYAVPAVVDLLRTASGDPGAPRLRRAAESVAALGHTTGPALLLGVAAVLAAVDDRCAVSRPAPPAERAAGLVGAAGGPS